MSRTLILTLTVSGVVGLGHVGTARAQCQGWACNGSNIQWSTNANPGRLSLSSTETTFGNVGIQFDLNFQGGPDAWSLATVKVSSGGTPYQAFQFHYDHTAPRLMMQLNPTGDAYTWSIYPFSHLTYDLGRAAQGSFVPAIRWRTAYAQSVTSPSDARLKKDITGLGHGLAQVLKLRPVTFRWKGGSDDARHIGLIAQEVENVIPEVVTHEGDAQSLRGMRYAELVPVLINAIQTQRKTIQDHAARIASLEQPAPLASAGSSPQVVGAGLFLLVVPGLGVALVLRRRRAANPAIER